MTGNYEIHSYSFHPITPNQTRTAHYYIIFKTDSTLVIPLSKEKVS